VIPYSSQFLHIMRSRKNYAKSQEHVYKQVGQGSRQRFKLVPVAIPAQSGSANAASTSEASHSAPPIILGPTSAEEGPENIEMQPGDEGGWGPFEMPRQKKRKVRRHWFGFNADFTILMII
jgi:hypothetical protein